MKIDHLENMVRGWFVGEFEPNAFKTEVCEVGVKVYEKGDEEDAHYHKVATEITVIISGEVEMCNKVWKAKDIITLEPGDITNFRALSDAVCVVVKVPGQYFNKWILSIYCNWL